jgi:allantoinase
VTVSARVIRSRRVLAPDGLRAASVHVDGAGRIAAVAAWDAVPAGAELDDAGEAVLMPGLVDTHVHVNQPGRTEWEGFASATRAAAAGGITTLVDMPLNSIPATTSAAALQAKRAEARGELWVDVGFWGGVVPGNQAELAPLVAAGALGFKCFLVDSGVDEFPPVAEADLRPAMREVAELRVPLLVHAELGAPIAAATAALEAAGADPRRYATYLASRPPAAEESAIALMVGLCRESRARVHVVHHSAAGALPLIARARAEGLPLTAETCPHYLRFAAEDVPDAATELKCAPPIRERANREALWRALADGVLDLVASDHSPCAPALKRREAGDFAAAWGGIAGLQLSLAVTWTEASRRGHSLADLARWMSAAPARLAGLAGRKGVLAPGADADLVAWWPERRFVVDPARIWHRHPVTPYAGLELSGVVGTTWVRGRQAFGGGEHAAPPAGAVL